MSALPKVDDVIDVVAVLEPRRVVRAQLLKITPGDEPSFEALGSDDEGRCWKFSGARVTFFYEDETAGQGPMCGPSTARSSETIWLAMRSDVVFTRKAVAHAG